MDLSQLPLSRLRACYPGTLPGDESACAYLASAGGFSGALFWRIGAEPGWCLRRWPAGTTADRVAWIHHGIRRLAGAGVPSLAVPLATTSGASFVELAEGLFELAPWLPGRADFHAHPTDARLRSAMEWLARFHQAAARLAPEAAATTRAGASPGIANRLARCEELLHSGAEQLQRALPVGVEPFAREVAEPLIGAFQRQGGQLAASLRWAASRTFPVHLCLRDLWHDHVLFTDEELTGVVDYDALRIESPMADVSRLLGSLADDDEARWQRGWNHYAALRSCTPEEERLARIFDDANLLMAGLQWLDWLFLSRRPFADEAAARARAASWLRLQRSR